MKGLRAVSFVIICTILVFAINVYGGDQNNEDIKSEILSDLKDQSFEDFKGLGFGFGLSLTMYSEKKVTEADVIDGKVRLKECNNFEPTVLLESHYFFSSVKRPLLGYGPFVCLISGNEKVIEAFGFGFMFGFRRDNIQTGSFNIGIGVIDIMGVQVLGDGIEENKSLPEGETQVRYKKKDVLGSVIIFSFSF